MFSIRLSLYMYMHASCVQCIAESSGQNDAALKLLKLLFKLKKIYIEA